MAITPKERKLIIFAAAGILVAGGYNTYRGMAKSKLKAAAQKIETKANNINAPGFELRKELSSIDETRKKTSRDNKKALNMDVYQDIEVPDIELDNTISRMREEGRDASDKISDASGSSNTSAEEAVAHDITMKVTNIVNGTEVKGTILNKEENAKYLSDKKKAIQAIKDKATTQVQKQGNEESSPVKIDREQAAAIALIAHENSQLKRLIADNLSLAKNNVLYPISESEVVKGIHDNFLKLDREYIREHAYSLEKEITVYTLRHPQSLEISDMMGKILSIQGRYEDAIPYHKFVVKTASNRAYFFDSMLLLAYAQYMVGDNRAIETLNAAFDIKPLETAKFVQEHRGLQRIAHDRIINYLRGSSKNG